MRMIRVNLMVSLVLLLSASAAGQGAERISDHSVAPSPWRQLAKLTEAHGHIQDWLGWSVAISKDGNTAAVGAVNWCATEGNGCGQGAIFVFVKPASGWADMTQTAMLTASDGQPGEYLGESVAISDDGSTIIAGAPLWPADGSFDGAAFVFVRPRQGWRSGHETALLTSTDGRNVSLGQSVGISGGTAIAGGFGYNGSQGAVYVFSQPKDGWTNMSQTARLTPSDGTDADMGWSVGIEGGTVVAGSPFTGTGDAGNGVYVFLKPKQGWRNRTETGKLTASRGAGFRLGYSVSISSTMIAVGAPYRSNDNGAIYVYVKPTDGWRSMTETARLSVLPKSNLLGYSVAAYNQGKNIAAGDPGWRDGGGQGAAVLFTKPLTGWETTSRFKARLAAGDGINGDGLGFSTAAASSGIVAGAPYAMIGSNRQQGAVYVFGR